MARFLWGPNQKLIVPTPQPAFLMNEDDSGLCQMFKVGIPELPLIDFCKKYGDKTKRFIDGGAHMGAYSILLADEFKEVSAFEAQRRTFFQLCGNIFLNEKSNIQAQNLAITDSDESFTMIELYVVSDDGGGSTLTKPTDKEVKSTEWVDAIHIDSYMWDDVGLIKLDVEGAELKAIKGAKETIKRSGYPPILFESNGPGAHNAKRAELFKYLQNEFNYSIAAIGGFDNMFIALQQLAA